MLTNYIISCGTSQIDEKKLTDFLRCLTADEVKKLEKKLPNIRKEDFFNLHQKEFIKITDGLGEKWFEIFGSIGNRDNPFGAEISTIVQLCNKTVLSEAEKLQTHFSILSSDSCLGYFCSCILQFILISYFNAKKENVRIFPVGYLYEDPKTDDQVNQAMKNLVIQAYEALLDQTGKGKIQNRIIMTGGFKSILPCLTLFATVNGIELSYLFEQSKLIQILVPMVDLEERKNRENWIRQWQYVLEEGKVDPNSYLFSLLQLRVQNSNSVYFYR